MLARSPEHSRLSLQAALHAIGQRGVHELVPVQALDLPACLAFAVAALRSCFERPVLFVLVRQRGASVPLCPDGLQALGFDPARALVVHADSDREALWVIEHGLRAGVFAGLIACLDGLSFTASRRLALASRQGRGAAFLCLGPRAGGATAADTRWRLALAPAKAAAGPPVLPSMSAIAWAKLERAKHGSGAQALLHREAILSLGADHLPPMEQNINNRLA